MSGLRERAARAAWTVGSEVPGFTSSDATLVTDAVLAVAADVEGIAGVLWQHRALASIWIEEQRCSCGVRPPADRKSFGRWHDRHQAEAVTAHILDRP